MDCFYCGQREPYILLKDWEKEAVERKIERGLHPSVCRRCAERFVHNADVRYGLALSGV